MANNEEQEKQRNFIDGPRQGKEERHGGAYPTGASYTAK
jgi:hypothetical protein